MAQDGLQTFLRLWIREAGNAMWAATHTLAQSTTQTPRTAALPDPNTQFFQSCSTTSNKSTVVQKVRYCAAEHCWWLSQG